jgi:hypothetical protein
MIGAICPLQSLQSIGCAFGAADACAAELVAASPESSLPDDVHPVSARATARRVPAVVARRRCTVMITQGRRVRQ